MKSDLVLKRDIEEELMWEPILNAAEIGVAVKEGIVTLSGTVDSYAKKLAAERIAKKVEGIRAIAEDIEVRFPGSLKKKNDSDIARAILNVLKWYSAIKENCFKVKVEDGWVTIEGDIEWQYEKDAVHNAIGVINGVKGISNLITIRPRLSAFNIQKECGRSIAQGE